MRNRIRCSIVMLGCVYILFLLPSCRHYTLSDANKPDVATDTDSQDFYCRIEYSCSEGLGIYNYQLLLNDSVTYLRTKAGYPINPFIQVTLTDSVSEYIKSLLREIYSENKSIVKDQYINEDLCMASVTLKWNIALNMSGKRINESVNIINYMVTFDNPFHPQFEKLLLLTNAITAKMERDIYKSRYRYHEPEEWITEMFHGEYYEPYNEINSVNYQ